MKTSSSPTLLPEIYDLELRQKRLKRYDSEQDFLRAHVQDSLIERLTFIKRQFHDIFLFERGDDQFISRLQELGHGDAMATVSPVMTNDRMFPDKTGQEPWGSYSLVLSILSLHWVNDLPGMLWQICSSLRPDGLFLGAMLGGETLHELKHCFLRAEMELYGGVSPRVMPMIELQTASNLLMRAGFKLPVADREVVKVTYTSLRMLMTDLRLMGQTNVMHQRHKRPINRSLLNRVEELYQENYADEKGRLQATFEIIFLTGWTPHESQQQPLLPGSGRIHLSEVLS